jgi:hypothetical protein
MTLAPALSWMHLFPRDASYSVDESAPAFLRALCSTGFQSVPGDATRGDGHGLETRATKVLVGSTTSGEADGLVVINSKVDEEKLALDGFAYIRRFAVLPDLKTARWFVPLDSAGVSSAGFSLYSPARFSARLKVAAARVAAYAKLPVWYRDTITIAQRTFPPIERKLAELFDGASFRLAMSSGAPEPARNRKVSLAIIGIDGRIIGFAKVAHSPLSHRLMNDEARALPELSGRKIGAPQLLFAGDIDGAFVTLQKPLKGKPVSTRLSQNKLALLASLRSSRIVPASETNLVSTLRDRLTDDQLVEAFDEALPILKETRLPATIIHGDFAPWNLREDAGKVSAFDWEYAELDGLPYFDETHYRLQVGYLLENWSLDRALTELRQMQSSNDLGLSSEQMRSIQVVYFLDNLARLFSEGYDAADNDMVGWYCALLRKLVPARKEVVAA